MPSTSLDVSPHAPRAAAPRAAAAPAGERRRVRPGVAGAPGAPAALAARSRLFLPVVLGAQLMVVLDATIVNVALPHIQAALAFTTSGLSWVLNAYILTFGGLLLLGARSGDLAGRRRTFLAGIALFTLGSAAGGVATTSWMLLVARAAQGVGAAFVAPSSLALLTSAFAEGKERLRAIALFTTVSAAGGAIGLVVGGLLTEWASWRWVMFVNVPVGAAVLVVGRHVLPETARRRGRFDLTGAVSSTLGMAGLVLGLVEAGSAGWTSPLGFLPLAAGAALLALFVVTETRAAEPILPIRLLTSSTRSAANVARGLVYAGMYGMFFFLGQFLQDVRHESPIAAGITFLPMPVTIFATSQLAGRVLAPRFRAKPVISIGLVAAGTSLALASRIGASTSIAAVIGLLVLLGAGMGVSFVSLTSASLAGVPASDVGAASGLVNVSQQLGGAVGLAALVTVFADASGHASLVPLAARASATALRAQAVVVHGLDMAFLAAALFVAGSIVAVALGVRSPAWLPPRPAEDITPAQPHLAGELAADPCGRQMAGGDLLADLGEGAAAA